MLWPAFSEIMTGSTVLFLLRYSHSIQSSHISDATLPRASCGENVSRVSISAVRWGPVMRSDKMKKIYIYIIITTISLDISQCTQAQCGLRSLHTLLNYFAGSCRFPQDVLFYRKFLVHFKCHFVIQDLRAGLSLVWGPIFVRNVNVNLSISIFIFHLINIFISCILIFFHSDTIINLLPMSNSRVIMKKVNTSNFNHVLMQLELFDLHPIMYKRKLINSTANVFAPHSHFTA